MDELELALMTPEESRIYARKAYDAWWESTDPARDSAPINRDSPYTKLSQARRYCVHERKELDTLCCAYCEKVMIS